MRCSLPLLCVLLLCAPIAETAASATPEKAHHSHHVELGFAPGLAWLVKEGELAVGLHGHALMAIGHSRWRLGIGVEKLLIEERHDTFSGVVQYALTSLWSVSIAPGLTLEGDEFLPSVHLETVYEFALGRYHLGPVLELAADPDDVHLSLGVLIGFGL